MSRLAPLFTFSFMFCSPVLHAADPKYGPAQAPIAVPLSEDNAYFRQAGHPAPDFWRLDPFYVPQISGYSCSAAGVAMTLNALLNTGRSRSDQERNITQDELLVKVKGDWQKLLSPAGMAGRHGLTLVQLEDFMNAAMSAYSKEKFLVQGHQAAAVGTKELRDLRQALVENEKNPDDLMVVHFVQDDLTKAPGGPFPHISPIGAYDASRHRVLIFDVDREWYEPYWVPDEALLKAMAHDTKAFGRGGYIRVGKLGIFKIP